MLSSCLCGFNNSLFSLSHFFLLSQTYYCLMSSSLLALDYMHENRTQTESGNESYFFFNSGKPYLLSWFIYIDLLRAFSEDIFLLELHFLPHVPTHIAGWIEKEWTYSNAEMKDVHFAMYLFDACEYDTMTLG